MPNKPRVVARTSALAAAVALVVCIGGSPLQAEVAAEVDPMGSYLRTVVFTNASVNNPKIWSTHRNRPSFVALNPDGDSNGDLFPVIVEDAARFNSPWVAWSRFNGEDYDLAWSRWNDGWSEIRPVVSAFGSAGDDLDPTLSLDASGRPFLAWWRNEQGVGRVYVSVFLSSRWSDPRAVSDAGVDSRYPKLSVDGSLIAVSYTTASGAEERFTVFAPGPDSINDDLNPFETFSPVEEEDPGPVPTGGS
jgi:hypothetical protein